MSENDPIAKPGRPEYERPNQEFRCGRDSYWQKSCAQGPLPDGTCGGIRECAPFKRGDRYECRRPAGAGGPCSEGPRPDGTCSRTHPPCIPRPSLRSWRGRLALLAMALVVGGLIFFVRFGDLLSLPFSSIDPGPLTGKHARFALVTGCESCHSSHNKGNARWLMAAFQTHDMTAECIDCHKSGGMERKAHNQIFPNRTDLADIRCASCHTEHRGRGFDITQMADAQCNSCHKVRIKNFAAGHPDFRVGYALTDAAYIKFDHSSHYNQYFSDAKNKDIFPSRPNCAVCHVATHGDRIIRNQGFEKNCVFCHANSTKKNPLVLFQRPEGNAGDIQKISADDPDTPSFMAWLLDDPRDEHAYARQLQKLIPLLSKEDFTEFSKILEIRLGGASGSGALLSNLIPQGADAVSAKEPALGGWYWHGKELVYKSTGHADLILQAWIEFAVGRLDQAGQDKPERAQALQDALLNPGDGPGLCLKCHTIQDSVGLDGKHSRHVEWRRPSAIPHPHTPFSHSTHLPFRVCSDCHSTREAATSKTQVVAAQTSPEPVVIKAVKRETCLGCHVEGRVRHDCRLCHRYHQDPTSKEKHFTQPEKKTAAKPNPVR